MIENADTSEVLMRVRHLLALLVVLARAGGILALPIIGQGHLSQLLAEKLKTAGHFLVSVVAIRDVEGVDVSLLRRIATVDDPVGQLIYGAELGSATFACGVERLLVDLVSNNLVDDGDRANALGADPDSVASLPEDVRAGW